eukprot:6029905-Prymnesium_polylepis.4
MLEERPVVREQPHVRPSARGHGARVGAWSVGAWRVACGAWRLCVCPCGTCARAAVVRRARRTHRR